MLRHDEDPESCEYDTQDAACGDELDLEEERVGERLDDGHDCNCCWNRQPGCEDRKIVGMAR